MTVKAALERVTTRKDAEAVGLTLLSRAKAGDMKATRQLQVIAAEMVHGFVAGLRDVLPPEQWRTLNEAAFRLDRPYQRKLAERNGNGNGDGHAEQVEPFEGASRSAISGS